MRKTVAVLIAASVLPLLADFEAVKKDWIIDRIAPLPSCAELASWFASGTNNCDATYPKGRPILSLSVQYPPRCLLDEGRFDFNYLTNAVACSESSPLKGFDQTQTDRLKFSLLNDAVTNLEMVCCFADYIGRIPIGADSETFWQADWLAAKSVDDALGIDTKDGRGLNLDKHYRRRTLFKIAQHRWRIIREGCLCLLRDRIVPIWETSATPDIYQSFKSNIIERARLSPEEASGLFTKEWKNEVPLRVRDLDWYYDVKVDVEGLE